MKLFALSCLVFLFSMAAIADQPRLVNSGGPGGHWSSPQNAGSPGGAPASGIGALPFDGGYSDPNGWSNGPGSKTVPNPARTNISTPREG